MFCTGDARNASPNDDHIYHVACLGNGEAKQVILLYQKDDEAEKS